MQQQKKLTKDQVFQKLKHYCSYQERCHGDVKEKAYLFGLKKTDVEELTSKLIEEDYLNEERFAKLFAGGKFMLKHWGRNKIKYELKQKRISDYCISKALKMIDEKEYLIRLDKLAKKKLASIKWPGANHFVKMTKTKDYLLQKGFEPEYISKILSGFSEK